MYTNIEYSAIVVQSPCFLLFPFLVPLWSPFVSPYFLGTLLAVIGSCPPRSQVTRKLISPFPSPSSYTPLSKIPTPWGFPELNMHITKTTSRTWLPRSSTLITWLETDNQLGTRDGSSSRPGAPPKNFFSTQTAVRVTKYIHCVLWYVIVCPGTTVRRVNIL